MSEATVPRLALRLIVPHIVSSQISVGLVPTGINNWMATTFAKKRTILSKIKLSVGLAK